jgi:hypothetical protein
MSKRLSLSIGLVMLIAASMACSFAGTATEPTAVPPTTAPPSPPPINTLPAVATFPPIAPPTVAGEVLPTDTTTPTATETPQPSAGATAKPNVASSGPLSVRYEVVKIKRSPDDQAVMTLRVIATGGGGGYQYFHDNIKQAGATFDVLGRCGKPFVHTIKVKSASGESVAVPYFEAGTCPPV